MSDVARMAPELETPVNPYSLLEAVNHSSDTAHTGWLIFLAVMTYLVIAVAGVTHKDLLLQTPVGLPILQVPIQLAQFFQFAPIVLVLMHLGLVSQLTLLARETLEFDHAIRLLEATDNRTHPLRLEMNNFFFVQAIAGPHRSAVMSVFLHAMSWLTIVVLPVVLLLYIQVVFLPYHEVGITWTHRVALVLDIAMLVSIGVFLMRAETSFLQAFFRTTVAHPWNFLATVILLGIVALFSFFVATVPGEALDRLTRAAVGMKVSDEEGADRKLSAGFMMPFMTGQSDGALFGIFRRNLVVTDTDLVIDKEQTTGEPSMSLRGRDLRYAKLDRSDLHQVDLTGADLQEASLVGTDLTGAWLQCADLNELLLSADRVTAKCTSARRANFSRARLSDAHMIGIDLRGGKLEEARLEGAELSYSLLAGANLSSARLDKADLTGGVQAQGANFLIAGLQGADLTGAQLQFADFSSATMQGAVLNHAHLQGAVLRDADLEGATLGQAKLQGADLTGAKIYAADFRAAGIWMTHPPEPDASTVADFAELQMKPLDENEISALNLVLGGIESTKLKEQVGDALAPILAAEAKSWTGSPDFARWQGFQVAQNPAPGESLKTRLTDYLSRLMCKARWSNGAVATGIARRAQAQQFRGDLVALYEKLKAADCLASSTVLPRVLRDLASAADLVRGN